MSVQPLFNPVRMGEPDLPNRIVMAPLTRMRAGPIDHVPTALQAEYYAQRASAGPIVAEATAISPPITSCGKVEDNHPDRAAYLGHGWTAYQNGFEATSLADIAREAKVPLGNVYYYFKTKDEIGEAIVELRLAKLSAQRQRWNEAGSPKDRLCACVQGVFENKDCLAQLGCQVGTFCSEVHKAGGPVATRATEIFAQHLAWIESQFRALGKGKDSNGLAVHLLSAMQGVSVLAHTFHDSGLVARETKRLKSWIQSL